MTAPPESKGLQEIRFTRNAQAVPFFIAALGFLCLGFALFALSWDIWVSLEPLLDKAWYGLLVLPFVAGAAWAGWHLAKHAYMIFSPVGIELFPFFFPSKNMQVLYWNEVKEIGLTKDDAMMEVTLLGEHENKVFVTTAPLTRASRALLKRTIHGIQEQRAKGAPIDLPTEEESSDD